MLVIGYFIYSLTTSLYKIYSLRKDKEFYEHKLIELSEQEKELKEEINKLQDPEYIARYARENYLYSKNGEYILKLREDLETDLDKVEEVEENYLKVLYITIPAMFMVGGYIIVKITKKKGA